MPKIKRILIRLSITKWAIPMDVWLFKLPKEKKNQARCLLSSSWLCLARLQMYVCIIENDNSSAVFFHRCHLRFTFRLMKFMTFPEHDHWIFLVFEITMLVNQQKLLAILRLCEFHFAIILSITCTENNPNKEKKNQIRKNQLKTKLQSSKWW